jgi:hypothetical protein
MNLVRQAGSHANGCYATVFFVGEIAIKVFRRRDDAPPNHVREVFNSEVAAYQHSATISELCQYTNHFIGARVVCRIEGESGCDISHVYHLDLAYEMRVLNGNPIKIGELDSNLSQYIKSLFRGAGIMHMSDCSVFLDHAGDLANVIDFAMQEFELEHDPL